MEDLDDEFFRDICAWLYPPIRPRTHGQWVAVNSDGILTAVPLPDTPPSKRLTPISWAVRDNLLYVAKWANTVLTAFNYWLNSSGIGGYPVWEGYQFPPQVADLAGLAELPEIMRCQDFEHARANLKRADVHFSRLLSWCQGMTASQTTLWERVKKRAWNNSFVVSLIVIGLVVAYLVSLGTGLETVINCMRRFRVWLWP